MSVKADGVRFELTVPFGTTVFKTVVINHSTNHPFGASGQTRTVDTWLRRPLLYPTELLRHLSIYDIINNDYF